MRKRDRSKCFSRIHENVVAARRLDKRRPTAKPSPGTDLHASSEFLKRGCQMTPGTLPTEAATVNIIPIMTVDAARARGIDHLAWTGVTRSTREIFVCSIDYEPGLLVVIKIPDPPVSSVVAKIARRT
jgi:hypothetical protein